VASGGQIGCPHVAGQGNLFDIDGTLVDSTPVVERSWHTWAREYDVDAEEVMRVCHGLRTEDTVAEFVAPQQLAARWLGCRHLSWRTSTA